MIDQILEGRKLASSCDEKTLIVIERSYSVMLNDISISNRQGKIVANIFAFSDQVCTMFVCGGKKKFLRLCTRNFSIEPARI
jgi:hypothetical protein